MIWNCVDCTIVNDGDGIIVENRFGDPSVFEIATEIMLNEDQNVRVTLEFLDYVADIVGDNSVARSNIEVFLDYGDNVVSPITRMECNSECLNGYFNGNLGIRDERWQLCQFL